MARGRQQHVAEPAEHERPDRIALVAGQQHADGVLPLEHVEVIEPEVDEDFLELATPVHRTDEFRGRVFSTLESMTWSTMMISMMLAGIASQSHSPREIGVVAGALSSTTALFWGWAHWSGRLPEP